MTSKIQILYDKNFKSYRNNCKNYSYNDGCSSSKCACSAISEIMAYIENVLPSGMSNYEFYDFNGIYKGEEVIDKNTLRTVLNKISKYCFDKEINDLNLSRSTLNHLSYMDKRFENGSNLIIHGSENVYRDGVKKKSGKTLLASLVMKEAIWRRMFSTNRAFTYLYSPVSKIIDDKLSKKDIDNFVSPKSADWLCIDDIYDKEKQVQASILEDVFVYRQMKGLPTICIIKFDASTRSNLNDVVGETMSKCFSGIDNTFIVDVS